MKVVFAVISETCPLCNGRGYVAVNQRKWRRVFDLVNEGWRFSNAVRRVFGTDPFNDPLPPEDEICPRCNGEGLVEKKVPTTQLANHPGESQWIR